MLSKRIVLIVKPIAAFGGLIGLLQLEWMLAFYFPDATWGTIIPVTALAGGMACSWTLPRRKRDKKVKPQEEHENQQ